MSSTQLFIGYAHKSCHAEQVRDTFENTLNEQGIVARVDFRDKKNYKGEDFKVFFIHFDHENSQLRHMIQEIKRNGFVVLNYDRFWDNRQNKYLHRYWKVLPYIKKEVQAPEKFVPHIMTLEEAEAAGITAPKSKNAPVKAEEPEKDEKPKLEKAEKPEKAEKQEKDEKPKPLPLEPVPSCWKVVPPLVTSWDDAPEKSEPLPEIPPEKPKLVRQTNKLSNTQTDEYSAIEELFSAKPKRRRRQSSPHIDANQFAKLSLEEPMTIE